MKIENQPVSNSIQNNGTIDPVVENAVITQIEYAIDGIFGDRDLYLEASDFDSALVELGISNKKVTWEEVGNKIKQTCFSEDWLNSKGIGYSWPDIEPLLRSQDHPERIEAALMIVTDAMRYQDVRLKPIWLSNGIDSGEFYATLFLPKNYSEQTPVVYLSEGSSANPHSYSNVAAQWAAQDKIVLVLDHPSGYFSTGYEETYKSWGQMGLHDKKYALVQTMENALSFMDESYGERNFYLVDHSMGLMTNLAWRDDHESEYEGRLIKHVSLAGYFGPSTKGVFSSRLMTNVFRTVPSIFGNLPVSFSQSKTKTVVKMYADGNEKTANGFRISSIGMGDTSLGFLGTLPCDFITDWNFLEQSQIPMEVHVSVDDRSVAPQAILDKLTPLIALGLEIKIHLYFNQDESIKNNLWYRHILNEIEKKLDGIPEEKRCNIIFHSTKIDGHLMTYNPEVVLNLF